MNKKGQALTESLFVIPILIIFLYMTTLFAKWIIIDIRLNSAARYGAWLIVHSNAGTERVKDSILQLLSTNFNKPLFRNINDIKIEVSTGQDLINPAKVEVEYKFTTGNLFKIVPGFPSTIIVKGKCVVYNDTWMLSPLSNISKS